MTFPVPIRRAEELLQGSLRGSVQATQYGVYRVTGFGAKRDVLLEVRRDTLRTPWSTQLSGHLEADGFQTRLIGRVGAPLFAKVLTGAWTTLVLLLLVVGTVTGIALSAKIV